MGVDYIRYTHSQWISDTTSVTSTSANQNFHRPRSLLRNGLCSFFSDTFYSFLFLTGCPGIKETCLLLPNASPQLVFSLPSFLLLRLVCGNSRWDVHWWGCWVTGPQDLWSEGGAPLAFNLNLIWKIAVRWIEGAPEISTAAPSSLVITLINGFCCWMMLTCRCSVCLPRDSLTLNRI